MDPPVRGLAELRAMEQSLYFPVSYVLFDGLPFLFGYFIYLLFFSRRNEEQK